MVDSIVRFVRQQLKCPTNISSTWTILVREWTSTSDLSCVLERTRWLPPRIIAETTRTPNLRPSFLSLTFRTTTSNRAWFNCCVRIWKAFFKVCPAKRAPRNPWSKSVSSLTAAKCISTTSNRRWPNRKWWSWAMFRICLCLFWMDFYVMLLNLSTWLNSWWSRFRPCFPNPRKRKLFLGLPFRFVNFYEWYFMIICHVVF